AAAADWVVAIKAARASAVMNVFMGSFHHVGRYGKFRNITNTFLVDVEGWDNSRDNITPGSAIRLVRSSYAPIHGWYRGRDRWGSDDALQTNLSMDRNRRCQWCGVGTHNWRH